MSSVGLPNLGMDLTELRGVNIYIDRECNELTFSCWCLKVEKLGNVHHRFQQLLTELKKPTDAYELSIANRLYGEKKFQFRQVKVSLACHTFNLHPRSSVSSDQREESEQMSLADPHGGHLPRLQDSLAITTPHGVSWSLEILQESVGLGITLWG